MLKMKWKPVASWACEALGSVLDDGAAFVGLARADIGGFSLDADEGMMVDVPDVGVEVIGCVGGIDGGVEDAAAGIERSFFGAIGREAKTNSNKSKRQGNHYYAKFGYLIKLQVPIGIILLRSFDI